MNRRFVLASTFVVVMMMSVMVYGQQRGQGGRRGGMGMMGPGMGSAMLLSNEAVQKELQLTDEQKTEIREVMAAEREGRGERPNFQDMDQEARQKWMEERTKAAAEQMKKVAKVLDEKQLARLEQIRIQALGTRAYMDEEVAKKLDITEEQQEKMRSAQREAMQSMRDSGDQPGPEGFAAMREKMEAALKGLLTDEQQAKYKELIGEKFDTAQLMQRRGGGRRGN